MTKTKEYTIIVDPLSADDGGGFVARVLDLPGCLGDGETEVEAVRDAKRAIKEWIDEYRKLGRRVPEPGEFIREARQRRDDEIKFLAKLLDQLRERDKDIANIGARLEQVERDVQYAIEALEQREAWDRFEVITKVTRGNRQQGELFAVRAH